MRKFQFIVLLILWYTLFSLLNARTRDIKIIPLPEVTNPSAFKTDDTQFYIIEPTAIIIYQWKDFRFIKKFGSRGEGPQEFNVSGSGDINVTIHPDKLIVYTFTKLLEYKKDGTYIKEYRMRSEGGYGLTGNFYKFGNSFILCDDAPGNTFVENVSYYFCDSKLKKIKELFRFPFPIDFKEKKRHLLSSLHVPVFYKDNVFFNIGENFEIIGFDKTGEKIFHLIHPYEKLKVTQEYITSYHKFYKTQHMNRNRYEKDKKWFIFPEYFPAIRRFDVANDLIYVKTWKLNDKNQNEFLIFDLKGKYLRKVYLPLVTEDMESDYPYIIKDGQLIQLIENVDEEEWYLQITPFNSADVRF